MTRMLHVFHDICEKHGIRYNLAFGTLLGAYRHHGFIPWDLDADVVIALEDLPRLKQALEREIPDDMFFQDAESDPFYPSWTTPKLRDRCSNYVEWGRNNPQHKWHNGLQLDIFCVRPRDDGTVEVVNNPYKFNSFDANAFFTGDTHLDFAGKPMRVPEHALDVLLNIYGNVDLPPVHQRVAHEGVADAFSPCGHPASKIFVSK